MLFELFAQTSFAVSASIIIAPSFVSDDKTASSKFPSATLASPPEVFAK